MESFICSVCWLNNRQIFLLLLLLLTVEIAGHEGYECVSKYLAVVFKPFVCPHENPLLHSWLEVHIWLLRVTDVV